MRILFIGTVHFSHHCLQEVLHHGGRVVAVLTLAAERSRFNSDYADLEPVAAAHDIPVYHIRKVSDPDTVALIQSLEPDVIFVFGCSQLIPPHVLSLPRLGCIGTHPALLPRNRGRHPLIWALVEGLEESGLTFLYLDEGVDSGDILWQRAFPIALEDDAQTLYQKILALASIAIAEILPQLEQGTAPRIPQDHTQATYWRKRTQDDGEIDWTGSAKNAYNLIRGLTHPYPGAHTFLHDQRIIIWKSKLVRSDTPDAEHAPGTIIATTADGFEVQCGSGILEVVQWEFANECPLYEGQRLGSQAL
jgi:methionyl-tRNA formyltransferase